MDAADYRLPAKIGIRKLPQHAQVRRVWGSGVEVTDQAVSPGDL
jgi:hypothetical protein